VKTIFNLPQYRTIIYLFKPETGYYTKSEKQPEKTPLMRLPYELRLTPTQAEKIKCNAKELIVSRDRRKTGSYNFFTGIQETDFRNWFLGNDFERINEKKIISIILFHFSDDNSRLTVYYFSRYDKGKTDLRLRFANEIIPNLFTPVLV
jgi:hypothetical protein